MQEEVQNTPKYFLNQLEVRQDVELFQKFILLLENKTFLNGFINSSGLYTLDKILKKNFNSDHIQQYIIDSYAHILKSVPNVFLDHKDVLITVLTLIIKSKLSYPRMIACKILRKILGGGEESYKCVIEWAFNLYQKLHQEPTRFAHLMVVLKIENDHLVLVGLIKLVNTMKIHEGEFQALGYREILRSIQMKPNQHVKLSKLLNQSKLDPVLVSTSQFPSQANVFRALMDVTDEKTWVLLEKVIYDALKLSIVGKEVEEEEEEDVVPYERNTTCIFGEYGAEDDLEIGLIVEACPKWRKQRQVRKRTLPPKAPVLQSIYPPLKLNTNEDLHKMLDIIIDYIKKNCKGLEFVFKITGKMKKVETLKTDIINQKDISNYDDPHVVATLFKQFLKDLTIIPFEFYSMFMDSVKLDNTKRILTLKDIISKLPAFNKSVLEKTLFMLWYIVRSSERNKMNSLNLSYVFGGVLFKNSMDKTFNHVTYELIKNYLILFNVPLSGNWKQELEVLGSDDDDNEEVQIVEKTGNKSISREGLQLKKNPLTHKWGKTYCVIRDDQLLNFNTVEDFKKGKKASQTISLSFAVCDKEERKGHKAVWSIFSNGKTYLYESETELDRNEWVKDIKEVIATIYKKTK